LFGRPVPRSHATFPAAFSPLLGSPLAQDLRTLRFLIREEETLPIEAAAPDDGLLIVSRELPIARAALGDFIRQRIGPDREKTRRGDRRRFDPQNPGAETQWPGTGGARLFDLLVGEAPFGADQDLRWCRTPQPVRSKRLSRGVCD